ncbi:MAG: hypothetical protein ABI647_27110 [Gemmatimonadota bacterium]
MKKNRSRHLGPVGERRSGRSRVPGILSTDDLADIAGRYDRTLDEANEVFRYIQDILTRPRPTGVELGSEWVLPLMDLSARQTQTQELYEGPASGGWLKTAKRLGETLR